MAGDLAKKITGEESLLASDIVSHLGEAMNRINGLLELQK
jgi:hypothetical protein